jgi:hypothetical protein
MFMRGMLVSMLYVDLIISQTVFNHRYLKYIMIPSIYKLKEPISDFQFVNYVTFHCELWKKSRRFNLYLV